MSYPVQNTQCFSGNWCGLRQRSSQTWLRQAFCLYVKCAGNGNRNWMCQLTKNTYLFISLSVSLSESCQCLKAQKRWFVPMRCVCKGGLSIACAQKLCLSVSPCLIMRYYTTWHISVIMFHNKPQYVLHVWFFYTHSCLSGICWFPGVFTRCHKPRVSWSVRTSL